MAYMDFTSFTATGNVTPVGDTIVGALQRREWDVVRLARKDGIGSLREPGRLARALSRLTGQDFNRRLADPRLESLRRLAVLAWHYGYALPVSAIREFKAAGFSMDQLEAVLAGVSSARGERA